MTANSSPLPAKPSSRGAFLRPGWITVLIFLTLVFLMPVPHLRAEPERTNYLPGEKQTWLLKTGLYPGIANEYLFHTEGDPDILLGIIARDYGSNYLGLTLLAAYYLLAATLKLAFNRYHREAG